VSTLFTINKAPSSKLLDSCLRTAMSGDCILFIEDGVYHGISAKALSRIPEDIDVYSLKEDIIARGLVDRAKDRSQSANYRRFVQLCTEHSKVVSWF